MKKLSISLFCFFLVKFSFATIWLVDNNPNSPQPLSALQGAIDNYANSGDTIMVAGSPNSYGDVSITKPLTLIGEGYNDQLGVNSILGFADIRSSNVLFTGFKCNGAVIDAYNATGNTLSNVTIERCYFSFSLRFEGGPFNSYFQMHNIKVRNTISQGGPAIFYSSSLDASSIQFDSLIVENNIIYEPVFQNWGNNIAGANTLIFRNNLFFNGNNGANLNTLFRYTYNNTNFHDGIFYNNIFYDCNPTGSVNCTFMNNLTYGNGCGVTLAGDPPFGIGCNDTLPGPVNNNIYSQNPLFVNYAPLQPFSYNVDFHLSAGSPCIGTGVGGTNIGIYGGYYPFNIGEGPRIPLVDFVNISNTAVPQGSTFYLQFDARVRK